MKATTLTQIAIGLTLALSAVNVQAGYQQPAPRKLQIYCTQAPSSANADTVQVVEIYSQAGRAADYMVVSTALATDASKTKVDIDQLESDVLGSFQRGRIIHFITSEEGTENSLQIKYPAGSGKLNMLPSVYAGIKDGKAFSTAMVCTHIKK